MNESQSNINPGANNILDELLKKLAVNKQKEFVFLILGRTGVGKSSTINSLMGQEVARVNPYRATTKEVEFYPGELNGVKYVVIDTPGLCDALENKGNDQTYLELVRSKVSHFDCMWFVTPLTDTRVRSDEQKVIRLISEAFGTKVWEHALIVFTFAASVTPTSEYDVALRERTELIREEIEKCSSKAIAENVPSVAVDNKNEMTPDGKKWLGTLYTTVFSRISKQGLTAFLMATAPSLKPQHENHTEPTTRQPTTPQSTTPQPRIQLTQENKDEIKKRVAADIIPGFALLGAGVGTAFGGPVGAAIGGAVGAVVGFFAWLFD